MMLRFLLSLVVTATRISSASISTHSNEHREILKRHEKGYAALGPAMPADTATALLMEPLWTKALNTSLKAGGIDATGVHSVLNVTILPNSDLNVSIALSSKNPEMSVQFLNKHRHIIR